MKFLNFLLLIIIEKKKLKIKKSFILSFCNCVAIISKKDMVILNFFRFIFVCNQKKFFAFSNKITNFEK